jgi:hypothetical protein
VQKKIVKHPPSNHLQAWSLTHMHKLSNNPLNHCWQAWSLSHACTKMSNKPIESFSSMITLTCTKMSRQPVASFSKVHQGFWHVLFHQEATTLDNPTSMTQKFVELIRSGSMYSPAHPTTPFTHLPHSFCNGKTYISSWLNFFKLYII